MALLNAYRVLVMSDVTNERSDNLTAICELTVQIMWEPRRLTNLQASTCLLRGSIYIVICR
jgi:hypothetical protein